jgi:hypothetical protein
MSQKVTDSDFVLILTLPSAFLSKNAVFLGLPAAALSC